MRSPSFEGHLPSVKIFLFLLILQIKNGASVETLVKRFQYIVAWVFEQFLIFLESVNANTVYNDCAKNLQRFQKLSKGTISIDQNFSHFQISMSIFISLISIHKTLGLNLFFLLVLVIMNSYHTKNWLLI